MIGFFDFIERKNLTCKQFIDTFSAPNNLCQSGRLYVPDSSHLKIWKEICAKRDIFENQEYIKLELSRLEYISENYIRNDLYFRNKGVFAIFVKESNNIITVELATNCGENIDEEEIKKLAYEMLQLEKEDIIDITKYFNL